jgi:putative spermidine/putrescine transport system ATP-binding protein
VSLSVGRGEFLTLLGPSGSGKTTLLMMIAGFVTPTAGEIQSNGASIAHLLPEKRNFGMVFQGYALFPHLTVYENVAFPLRVRRKSREIIERQVREALALVQLDGLADRYPRQLSGGQQQRVALARSLSFSPEILLLDEPLGALDRKLRAEVQIQLKELHRQVGRTFIYVTHDQEEALSMSDRIAIVRNGRIVQSGSPMDLYERPATRFVAGFLGESNFISGRVLAGAAGRIDYEVAGRRFLLEDGERSQPTPGETVLVALRPEKIEVSDSEPGAAANRVSGRLRNWNYFGSTIHFGVEVEGLGVIGAVVQSWRNAVTPREGMEVWLSWDAHATTAVVDD